MTFRTTRFKVLYDRRMGKDGARLSFRIRWPNRPYQINFTISRYVPAREKGVS